MHDDASYVPVQDVVKAFRKDFNVDISYKECHQMIFSAFTSPRNRLIPRKTVRVTSIGQQYVYRGIAPLNKAACSSKEIAQVWFIIDLFVFSGHFSFLRRRHGTRTRVSTPANHNTSKQHNVNQSEFEEIFVTAAECGKIPKRSAETRDYFIPRSVPVSDPLPET